MPRRQTAGATGSLSAQDWIRAAVRVIAAEGVGKAAVESLARRLGVTKGSFYWHFANRDALLQAVLAQWEQLATETVIATLDQVADPRERLRQLITEAFHGGPRPNQPAERAGIDETAFELALADALGDPIVGPVVRRVTERRIAYVEDCYRALGLGEVAARQWALLAFSSYVGSLRLSRELPGHLPRGEAFEAYGGFLRRVFVPPPDPAATS